MGVRAAELAVTAEVGTGGGGGGSSLDLGYQEPPGSGAGQRGLGGADSAGAWRGAWGPLDGGRTSVVGGDPDAERILASSHPTSRLLHSVGASEETAPGPRGLGRMTREEEPVRIGPSSPRGPRRRSRFGGKGERRPSSRLCRFPSLQV